MKNKISLVIPIATILVFLTACAGQSAQATPTSVPSSNSAGSGNSTGSRANSSGSSTNIDSRLAPGILMLANSPQAVTAAQAKQLLPLWQQIQSLETSGTSSNSDYQTDYQKIEAILTPAQIQDVQTMTFNQSDMQTLMTKLGIQITPGANFGGSRPTMSPNEVATLTAEGTQNPGRPGGRFFSGTGTPPAFTPGANGGRSFPSNGTPPASGQFSGRGQFGSEYVTAVIQFLQKLSGS